MDAATNTEWLDVHVGAQHQLFNAMDPAPFRQRDLAGDVATYIEEWAEEIDPKVQIGIRVTLTVTVPGRDDSALIRDALHENFERRASEQRRLLRKLFRDGRISLAIGIAFVALAIAIAEAASAVIPNPRTAQLVEDSVVIGAWVALWQPINIFLYDWWPIRASVKLYERLARASVELGSVGCDLTGAA